MKRPILIMAIMLTCLAAFSVAAPLPDYDACLVDVIVTYQAFNVRAPWQKNQPQTRQGYAVVIGPGLALTAETLVRDNTQIEMRRAKSGLKLMATVKEADQQRNLALLEFDPSKDASQLKAVELAETVRSNEQLTIVKMEQNGEFQTSIGQVVEISASGAPKPLAMKVLTQLNLAGAGIPVFAGDRLAGLSVNFNDKSQIALCVPCMTIRVFLDDAQSASYKGLAWAGFNFEALLDPVTRAYLGAPENQSGFMVTKITPGSGASQALQSGDVIIEWDGFAVDAQGYYQDPDFGRLHCSYLISGRRAPGDIAQVVLIRNRTRQTVQLPLARWQDSEALIPESVANEPIEYLIEGGFLLYELTGDYLRVAGPKWKSMIHPRLVHYYLNPDKIHQKQGDHVVVLSAVLPDNINIGYQQLRDEVIVAVNGKPVRCMADVFQAVDEPGGLQRLALLGHGVEIILDAEKLAEANRRISAQYRIPRLRYQKTP